MAAFWNVSDLKGQVPGCLRLLWQHVCRSQCVWAAVHLRGVWVHLRGVVSISGHRRQVCGPPGVQGQGAILSQELAEEHT